MKRILWLSLMLLIFSQLTIAQPKARIQLIGTQTAFAGIDIPIIVELKEAKWAEIWCDIHADSALFYRDTTQSQGHYIFHPYKAEKAQLLIQTRVMQDTFGIGSLLLEVEPFPSPLLYINQRSDGQAIRRQDLNTSTPIRVAVNNPFLADIPLHIESYYFSCSEHPDPILVEGENLTAEILSLVRKVPLGQTITISNAKIVTPDGKEHSLSASYKVF